MNNKKQRIIITILASLFLILATSGIIALNYLGSIERVGYIEINTKNEEKGIYIARLSYYDKIFRNSDIYKVYVKTETLPDNLKDIKWISDGGPIAEIALADGIATGDRIENIYYTLSLNPAFKYLLITLMITVIMVVFLKKQIMIILSFTKKDEGNIISEKNGLLIYYIILAFAFLLSFLYYLNVPLWGDDWWYATMKNFQEIYVLKSDWHPGRHITEFLHIFPTRILGTILGSTINNMLFGVKIIHGLVSAFVTIGLSVLVGKFYGFEKRKLFSIMFILMSIFLNKMYVEFTVTSQIWGGYLMSFICFSPIAYFFTRGQLPEICRRAPNKFYGIWLAVTYVGTQVFDIAAWIIAGLSFLAIVYMLINKDMNADDRKMIIKLSTTIIIFTLFAIFRNTFLSDYGSSFVKNESLYIKIFKVHIEKILRANVSTFSVFSLMLGIVFFCYYLYKNIKMRFKNKKDFFILSLLFTGYLTLHVSVDILDRYPDLSIVLIWIAILNVLLNAYNDKKIVALYIIPTIILGLIVGTVGQFGKQLIHPQASRKYFITQRINERVAELYKEADAKDMDYLYVKKSKADELYLAFRVPQMWTEHMSIWMYEYGYTKKILPVVIVEDDNNISVENALTNK